MPTSLDSRRPRSRRIGRIAASSVIALAAAAGATLATAPTASAVGKSGCSSLSYDRKGHVRADSVNLRNGPGTSYSSKGLLAKGTKTFLYCFKSYDGNRWSWDYLKVTSGPHKGVKGWVRSGYHSWD
ncbi:SH3 domain-containing protein [Streptomyces sp. NPDC059037]|uniref:SH3 domain-containing protein n=1 Tax=Streptomyces sp. NPDC059037 TaxID=3346710 RepID=UPI00368B9C77